MQSLVGVLGVVCLLGLLWVIGVISRCSGGACLGSGFFVLIALGAAVGVTVLGGLTWTAHRERDLPTNGFFKFVVCAVGAVVLVALILGFLRSTA